jgi:hypothetical protein
MSNTYAIKILSYVRHAYPFLLTLFPVEHTSALDRVVVEYLLVEVPSTGRSNRPGGPV